VSESVNSDTRLRPTASGVHAIYIGPTDLAFALGLNPKGGGRWCGSATISQHRTLDLSHGQYRMTSLVWLG
jgi:hypothetical protein